MSAPARDPRKPLTYDEMLVELKRWAPPQPPAAPAGPPPPNLREAQGGGSCASCVHMRLEAGRALSGYGLCTRYSCQTRLAWVCDALAEG